jgi:2'-hydroxyisoflavone reductase
VLGEKATIVRPIYIVGPGDETDRFTYWVDRMARGGDVLGPPDPKSELQWVDVRDLCPWILGLAERDVAGIFNVAGPSASMTWEEVLVTLGTRAERSVKYHWASTGLLKELDIELPLVVPGRPSRHFANAASQAAGLKYRPLEDTAAATLEWWRAQPETRRAQPEGWLPRDKELEAIARLRSG